MSPSPIDYPRFLQEMCADNIEFADKLIRMLIDERGPKMMADIVKAVEQKNLEKIRLVCHTLNGTAHSLCAYNLAEKTNAIGTMAKNGQLDELKSVIDEMQKAFDDIKEWDSKRQP